MKLGIVSFEDKMYDLNELNTSEIEELLKKINIKKSNSLNRIKELLDGDGVEIYQELKRTNKEVENNIKDSAIVQRAYINKITMEMISDKVAKEMNAVKNGIVKIYPGFKEGTRNYIKIKNAVSLVLVNYEKNLQEIGHYYDHKIEVLILERVEVESSHFFSILAEKYFNDKVSIRNDLKNDNKVGKSIKKTIVDFIDRITKKKTEKKIMDPLLMDKIMDNQDVISEISNVDEEKYNNILDLKAQNEEDIRIFNDRISDINRKIDEYNDEKVKEIREAMEEGPKDISKDAEEQRKIGIIRRFFLIRFNLLKYVQENMIYNLENRIELFEKNELPKLNDWN